MKRSLLRSLLAAWAACTPTPSPPPDAGSDAGVPDAGTQPTTCGPATCPGCCDDAGTCRAGRAADQCGAAGATCEACPAGHLCSAGACITVTRCDASCGSCCAGESCRQAPCGNDAGQCATCAAGELCQSAACVTAPASRWRLRIVSATVAATRPSGEPWDEHNDPDPKVCAGAECTLEETDTFSPAWNALLPGVYEHAELEAVVLSVIDVDFPGQTVIEELGAVDLRPRWSGEAQRWTLDGASVTKLRIDVEPAP